MDYQGALQPPATVSQPARRPRRTYQNPHAGATVGETTGNTRVIYVNAYPTNLGDWSWTQWVIAIGSVILFGVVVAGFILLVIQGRRCCL